MPLNSIHNNALQETIIGWIEMHGEVFVHVHHPHSGASGENYFLRSAEHLQALIASLAPKSVMVAYRQPQFSLRLVLAPDRIPQILEGIPDGIWWSIVDLASYPQAMVSYGSGNTRQELLQALEELMGGYYGIGIDPLEPEEYWNFENTTDIIVAQAPA